MQAVIMAGGKGTRLAALTKDEIPKPMVPVAGKPILLWQVEQLKAQGVTEVILVIGYLGHKIREFFGDGAAFGVAVSYLEEKEPLGTGGSLALLAPLLKPEPFFLVFGDVLFEIDLGRMARFHQEKGAQVTLFVHPNAHPFDSDLVETDGTGRVLQFDSKHNDRSGYWYDNCVNAGLYLLDPTVCSRVQPVKTDLEKEVLAPLIRDTDSVYAYRSPEYVKDVGTLDRIAAAEQDLAEGLPRRRDLRNPQRAVFLDRDGTVNVYRGLVSKPEELELEEKAAAAIRLLNSSGYLVILVTNQPVVARGMCSVEDVETIHNKLKTLLGREGAYLDDVRFCPHHPDKGYPEENPLYKIPCHCRKPDIGMLEDCAERYHIDLCSSWVVGDTSIDIRTGKNAGAKTVLVQTGCAGTDGKYDDTPDYVCRDLLEAARMIGRT